MLEKKRLDEYFDLHRDEMIRDICRLVRIPSERGESRPGMPYGEGPAKALNEAMKIAEELGFSVKNYENYVCTADLNSLPTELDILAHLDVVPVSDSWTVTQPFAPLVQDGRIYGRGTADDKGPAVAALYAMKAVKDLGIPLTKNVRAILGTDEECGSSDLEHYYAIEKEAPKSFSPDADFPLINLEKGGLRGAFSAEWKEDPALPRLISADSGTKLNVVPDKANALVEGLDQKELEAIAKAVSQKTGVQYTITPADANRIRIDAKGVGAHAASPQEGNNALTGLLRLLVSLPLAESEGFTRLKTVEKFFPHGDWLGKAANVAMEDELSGYTTLSFDIFHYNLTGLQGEFDCRASILANDQNLRDVIRDELQAEGITLAPCSVFAPHHVPADSPFVQTLLSCYEAFTGEKGYCISIGGGTYVHHLQNGVAFGCARTGVNNRMHGDDEFAEIDQLILSAKIFAAAIAEICG
ncbi:MAG: Sapep family Mn(2+)-dependent dipeptidase [Candidatus Merdivicinus sp.]|jgi:succinyl-diaminopimelate desuccinylase